MSVALRDLLDKGLVTDVFLPLVSLYTALQRGWEPPSTVTEEEYQAARGLPDTDPLKAFVGFGCSFGAKLFGGYARDRKGCRNFADESRRSLLRDIGKLSGCEFRCLSFLDVEPYAAPGLVIYCDPPYIGTTGYKGTPSFDHAAFATRCEEWVSLGVPVFVSEYTALRPSWEVIWTKPVKIQVTKEAKSKDRVERLFKVRV